MSPRYFINNDPTPQNIKAMIDNIIIALGTLSATSDSKKFIIYFLLPSLNSTDPRWFSGLIRKTDNIDKHSPAKLFIKKA